MGRRKRKNQEGKSIQRDTRDITSSKNDDESSASGTNSASDSTTGGGDVKSAHAETEKVKGGGVTDTSGFTEQIQNMSSVETKSDKSDISEVSKSSRDKQNTKLKEGRIKRSDDISETSGSPEYGHKLKHEGTEKAENTEESNANAASDSGNRKEETKESKLKTDKEESTTSRTTGGSNKTRSANPGEIKSVGVSETSGSTKESVETIFLESDKSYNTEDTTRTFGDRHDSQFIETQRHESDNISESQPPGDTNFVETVKSNIDNFELNETSIGDQQHTKYIEIEGHTNYVALSVLDTHTDGTFGQALKPSNDEFASSKTIKGIATGPVDKMSKTTQKEQESVTCINTKSSGNHKDHGDGENGCQETQPTNKFEDGHRSSDTQISPRVEETNENIQKGTEGQPSDTKLTGYDNQEIQIQNVQTIEDGDQNENHAKDSKGSEDAKSSLPATKEKSYAREGSTDSNRGRDTESKDQDTSPVQSASFNGKSNELTQISEDGPISSETKEKQCFDKLDEHIQKRAEEQPSDTKRTGYGNQEIRGQRVEKTMVADQSKSHVEDSFISDDANSSLSRNEKDPVAGEVTSDSGQRSDTESRNQDVSPVQSKSASSNGKAHDRELQALKRQLKDERKTNTAVQQKIDNIPDESLNEAVNALKEEVRALKETVKTERSTNIELNSVIQKLQDNEQTMNTKLEKECKKIEDLQNEIMTLQDESGNEAVTALEQEVSTLRETVKKEKSTNKELNSVIQKLQDNEQTMNTKLEKECKKNEDLQNEIMTLQDGSPNETVTELEQEVSTLKENMKKAKSTNMKLNSMIQKLQDNEHTMNTELETELKKNEDLQNEIKALQDQSPNEAVTALEQEVSTLKETMKKERSTNMELNSVIQKLQDNEQTMNTKLESECKKNEDLQNEIKTLQETNANTLKLVSEQKSNEDESLKKLVNNMEKQVKEMQESVEREKTQNFQLNNTIQQLQGKLDEVKHQWELFEKDDLKERKHVNTIRGILRNEVSEIQGESVKDETGIIDSGVSSTKSLYKVEDLKIAKEEAEALLEKQREELKTYRDTMAKHAANDLKRKIKDLETCLQEERHKYEQFQQSHEEQCIKYKGDMEKVIKAFQAAVLQTAALKKEKEKLLESIKNTEEELVSVQTEHQTCVEDISELRQQLQDLQQENCKITEQFENLREQHTQWQSWYYEVESARRETLAKLQEKTSLGESLQSKLTELQNEVSTKNDHISRLVSESETKEKEYNAKKKQLQDANHKLKEDFEKVQQAYKSIFLQKSALQKENERLSESLKKMEEKETELMKNKEELEYGLAEYKEQVSQLTDECMRKDLIVQGKEREFSIAVDEMQRAKEERARYEAENRSLVLMQQYHDEEVTVRATEIARLNKECQQFQLLLQDTTPLQQNVLILQRQIQESHIECQKIYGELQAKESDLRKANYELEIIRKDRDRIQGELTRVTIDCECQRTEKSALKDSLHRAEETHRESINKISHLTARVQEKWRECEQQRAEIVVFKGRIDKLSSDIKILKDSKESLTKELMKKEQDFLHLSAETRSPIINNHEHVQEIPDNIPERDENVSYENQPPNQEVHNTDNSASSTAFQSFPGFLATPNFAFGSQRAPRPSISPSSLFGQAPGGPSVSDRQPRSLFKHK